MTNHIIIMMRKQMLNVDIIDPGLNFMNGSAVACFVSCASNWHDRCTTFCIARACTSLLP
jgi:hypothetical protein